MLSSSTFSSSIATTNKPFNQTYVPPHKIRITDPEDLKTEKNATDLMKDLNISSKNLLTFLTFYQTLHYQLKHYNVFIRDLNDVDVNELSEPKIFMN